MNIMNTNKLSSKNILFIHFRTGERDGVSLEIEKRAKILKDKGYSVYFLTGYDPRTGDNCPYSIELIPQLDIKRRLTNFLRESFFQKRILDNTLTWLIYHSEEEKIYRQVIKVLKRIKPSLIFIHNVFSTAYHLPATTAIIKALDHQSAPTVCLYHDFWWERYNFKKTNHQFIQEIIENLPPVKSYIIRHQVINSLAQKQLWEKRRIKAEKIGDYFDFDMPLPKKNHFNQDFRLSLGIKNDDIVILHATRIVERKAIENAIIFAKFLEIEIKKRKPSTKVHLVLPNFIEVESHLYFKKLKQLADELGVSFIWCGDRIALERKKQNGLKIYSFWDTYLFADLTTYTSFAEGFGNQLLEAFWARKIPVVFEYPVFKRDIKKEGYKIISLGDKMRKKNGFWFVPKEKIKAAVAKLLTIFTQKRVQSIVNHNFKLAKKYHDLSFLEDEIENLLSLAKIYP